MGTPDNKTGPFYAQDLGAFDLVDRLELWLAITNGH
jgi:hypothetical protein